MSDVSEIPDKPWFREYDSFGVPETLEPYPDQPVHQFLYDAAESYPDQGLVQLGQKYEYPELADHVDSLATALRERGVEKGSRVATILPTSAQFIVAENAISRAGGEHIPNDFLDAEEDLKYRLETGDPEVLIGQNKHRDLVMSLKEELGLSDVILTDIEDYSDDTPDHDDVAGVEWLPEVIENTDPDPPDVEFDVAEDVHTVLFTGGTTGLPKGCQLTHRNLVANALQGNAVQSRMADMMRGSETAVLALPLYHAYGYSVQHSLIELGLEILLVPDARDTEMMTSLIEDHEPLVMMGVPTQFMEIVNEDLEQDVIGLSGSAPLASETKEKFEEKSKGVSQGYGLSEMSPITHFNVRGLQDMLLGKDTREQGFDMPTIGVPAPDTEVKLVDVESGEEIPLQEAIEEEREGEMLLNGPQRMKGYLDDDKDPFDDEGFVATGDVAKIDPMGRFYIVDRVKNMINVSGLKVYSEEVDEVLFSHPGIHRPATVGAPDPDRPGSEIVVIYVEEEADYDGDLTEADVRDHLDGKVPKQAMPEEVHILDEIPLTDVGKTDKQALKERHE
ncbi:AMP-binding protein [Halorientalis litorea]|uniref:AMP-binding protein n=1 Tax=Halorientalis litorea TaxID=2931977 RepID=UPI001FF1FD44|nr:class I adenylate-forming enzyme family protein [Halorientalis litorea]